MERSGYNSDVSDRQWERLQEYLPELSTRGAPLRKWELRVITNAILSNHSDQVISFKSRHSLPVLYHTGRCTARQFSSSRGSPAFQSILPETDTRHIIRRNIYGNAIDTHGIRAPGAPVVPRP